MVVTLTPVTRQRFQKASLRLAAATLELRTAVDQVRRLTLDQEAALKEFRDAIEACTGVDINLGLAYATRGVGSN